MKKRTIPMLLCACLLVSLFAMIGSISADEPICWGDANGDSEIDGKDLVRIKKYLAAYDFDTESSDVEICPGADANGDGKVDGKDLVRIKKYIAAYDYDTGTSDVVLGPTNSDDDYNEGGDNTVDGEDNTDPDGSGWTDFFPLPIT